MDFVVVVPMELDAVVVPMALRSVVAVIDDDDDVATGDLVFIVVLDNLVSVATPSIVVVVVVVFTFVFVSLLLVRRRLFGDNRNPFRNPDILVVIVPFVLLLLLFGILV